MERSERSKKWKTIREKAGSKSPRERFAVTTAQTDASTGILMIRIVMDASIAIGTAVIIIPESARDVSHIRINYQ